MRTVAIFLAVLAVPVVAAPKRFKCESADGAMPASKITIELEQPDGATFNIEACGFELDAKKSISMVNAIRQDDSGPEQLLNEEDGAQKWVLELSKGKLKPITTEKLKLAGDANAVVYRLTGEFHGDKDAEVLVARVKSGKHNIVFTAQYPYAAANRLRSAALQIFSSATVKIELEAPSP